MDEGIMDEGTMDEGTTEQRQRRGRYAFRTSPLRLDIDEMPKNTSKRVRIRVVSNIQK